MAAVPNFLRTIRDLVLNLLTAALGTAIAESEFYHLFRPQTLAGIYTKELVLSGSIAFVLGCLVYFKWRSRTSQWVWVLGLVGFAWRVVLGNEPATLYAEAQRATLGFVSVRLVAYSAGAVCCAGVVKTVTSPEQKAQSIVES
jgi:hypothetical protein